jgi:hypothetical protein
VRRIVEVWLGLLALACTRPPANDESQSQSEATGATTTSDTEASGSGEGNQNAFLRLDQSVRLESLPEIVGKPKG